MVVAAVEPGPTDPLSAGHRALRQGAWEQARTRFEEALQERETPAGREGLGLAAWWLEDAATTIEARERAYRLYREGGDRRSAARMAIWLAWDCLAFRGEPAVANGWLQRARRLLAGFESVPEHGWLALHEGNLALALDHDTTRARAYGAQMAALGRTLGSTDLEMLGLALEGLALVSEGQVAEGMRRLDEASAAALAGELDLVAVPFATCYLIYACERVRDFDRAAQWCDRVKEFCKQWRVRGLFAICRTHYASVLIARGVWAEAEEELAAATCELKVTRPALVGEGTVRLAELRRRQGRWEEAAGLFAQVESHSLAQLGRSALALDQGDAETATDLIGRLLRRIPLEDRTERAAGLELLVRAKLALGECEPAALALAELQTIATMAGTEPLRASANFAAGLVAAAGEDYETARHRLEEAVDLFERSGVPFETAQARLELARVLQPLGRWAAAEHEARAAWRAYQELGAARETNRAAAFLEALQPTSVQPTSPPASGTPKLARLTPRELEVLQLLSRGLSNQKIAERLVLSEHTVHRHVSSILTKLDLPTRAAAAAHAVRHGLLA